MGSLRLWGIAYGSFKKEQILSRTPFFFAFLNGKKLTLLANLGSSRRQIGPILNLQHKAKSRIILKKKKTNKKEKKKKERENRKTNKKRASPTESGLGDPGLVKTQAK